jgi:hypothetical protein
MGQLISRLFGGGDRKTVICPKCQAQVQVNKDATETKNFQCPANLPEDACAHPYPIRYIQNYDYAKPLFVQVFGWSAHGKTVFLDALRMLLLDMRKLWPEYTYQSITQTDMEKERELRSTLRKGILPDATQLMDLSQNDYYIMLLEQMPRYAPTWLIIMDHAGEMFTDFDDIPVDRMPYLLNTQTTFFLISIHKLKSDDQGWSMDQLLNIYIETMLRNGVNFRKEKRQIVIVFTMGDMLVGDLPSELRRYLVDDDMWNQLRTTGVHTFGEKKMQDYLDQMYEIDGKIRDWLLSDSDGAPGGANLVGLLKSNQIDARFSIISATGHNQLVTRSESKDKEGIQIRPRRVLDPFLWTMEYEIKQKANGNR